MFSDGLDDTGEIALRGNLKMGHFPQHHGERCPDDRVLGGNQEPEISLVRLLTSESRTTDLSILPHASPIFLADARHSRWCRSSTAAEPCLQVSANEQIAGKSSLAGSAVEAADSNFRLAITSHFDENLRDRNVVPPSRDGVNSMRANEFRHAVFPRRLVSELHIPICSKNPRRKGGCDGRLS